MCSEDLDLVIITESWINENSFGDQLQDYDLDNYDTFLYQRKTKIGGGILVYVKTKLRPFVKNHINTCEEVESLWIDISPDANPNNKIRIGTFYRPPNQSKELDLAMIDEIERGLIKNTILIGDFNLPKLLKDGISTNWETALFREGFEELFLTQHVLQPTRFDEILDLILTNNESLLGDVVLGESLGNSDHVIIRFSIKCQFKRMSGRLYFAPNFAKGDYEAIRLFLGRIEWTRILEGKDVYEMWNIFKNILAETQYQFIPMKKRLTGKSFKPIWFNSSVQTIFHEKKRAFCHFKTDPSAESKEIYTKAKKTLKKIIREAKRASEIRLANECDGDLKKFFGFYKFNKHVARIGPIENDGQVYHGDAEKARAFNEQFSNVFTDECLTDIPMSKNTSLRGKLSDIQISHDDVIKHLRAIKANKACGPDDISARILKEAATELATPLYIIFNLSLKSGEIPDDWKCAYVVPIFKGGKKSVVGNYRPVSLTSIACKILERIIKHHIITYLEHEQLLLPSQHGFRSGRSCLTNLIDFLEYVTNLLDKGKKVSVVYLDFCKAFDKVPHRRLLVSLQNHGLGGSLLRWVETWLLGRKQRVILNGHQAVWKEVRSGVPQGTVLAPLFFIIFVNLIDSDLTSRLWKFADDIKLARVISSDSDKSALQIDLDNLFEWTVQWQMEFNVKKCKVLNLGASDHETYNLNGNTLQNVCEERDLGVLITDDLKFSRHYQEARKKALKMLGILNRNVNYKSKDVMKKLYCAFVRPHLEYCIQACYSPFKKDIKSLERVQRKATKMVRGLSGLCYRERLISLNLFSLHYRRIRGDLIELFKIYKGIDKLDFEKLFMINSNHTRGHTCKLVKKFVRTSSRQSFFTNRVIDFWNKLPSSIINSSSINEFKHMLDMYFIEHDLVFNTDDI